MTQACRETNWAETTAESMLSNRDRAASQPESEAPLLSKEERSGKTQHRPSLEGEEKTETNQTQTVTTV